MLKAMLCMYVACWALLSVPLILLAAPWGTRVHQLGFYFYRYNSGMTLSAPVIGTIALNWERGSLKYKTWPPHPEWPA
jgi:hypothetical protein